MNTTFSSLDGDVTVSFLEAAQLYTFCVCANVDLHTFSSYTVTLVIGALSVGSVQEVAKVWNTGALNKG